MKSPAADVREYTSLVVDKANVGLHELRKSLNENGFRTAEQLGIQLSVGSMKLKHHQHVFMWDSSPHGRKGHAGIASAGGCVTLRIRMKSLSEQGYWGFGNLKGDNPTTKGLGGVSETGAWAHEGTIHRRFLFIEGLDHAGDTGFMDWDAGDGWPESHAESVKGRYGYDELS